MINIRIIRNNKGSFNLLYNNLIISLGNSYNVYYYSLPFVHFRCLNSETNIPIAVGSIKIEKSGLDIASMHMLNNNVSWLPLIKTIDYVVNNSYYRIKHNQERTKKLDGINSQINDLLRQRNHLLNN